MLFFPACTLLLKQIEHYEETKEGSNILKDYIDHSTDATDVFKIIPEFKDRPYYSLVSFILI